MRPQPSCEPVSEGYFGQTMGQLRATTELYLPFLFSDITCNVLKFEIEIKNISQMTIRTSFRLNKLSETSDNLYKDEIWKTRSIENFLKATKPDIKIDKKIAPVFILMLNKFLRVENARLDLDGDCRYVLFDQTPDIVMLPTSYPPFSDAPNGNFYNYYEKKNTAFYAPLEFDRIYKLEIDLEAVAPSFELAPLFPYGKVDFSNVTMGCFCSGGYEVKCLCMRVNPITDNQCPDWLKYKIGRKISSSAPPLIIPADPFRGASPLFDITEELGITKEDVKNVDNGLIIPLSKLKGVFCEEYETFRLMFAMIIPPEKNYDVIIRIIQAALPTRIYEQLQKIPGYNDVLVEFDIVNLTHTKKNIKISSELSGLTDVAVDEIVVEGMGNEQKKPARVIVKQCPLMKYGILETIVNPQRATLYCKVIDSDTEKIIYEKSYNIDLLPHDQMIWEIRDVAQSRTHNLADFICAWVHPTDKEGLLDLTRANSIKYHPDNAFGHRVNTLLDIEKHVRAIWDYLSKDLKIKYLSQPFSSKNSHNSQRVLLPEKVLNNKAGNCIDLTILFASLLEGIGIFSIIFLTEDHAFIGWGNSAKTSEMFFLETTLLGRDTFENAKIVGEKKFRENFLFVGLDDPIPDLVSVAKGCHIVDLSTVRSAGIVSNR
jgi:hypothetical protein